ncbi:MAG: hypothetical protein HY725_05900 [Candidatus Rokubacteria bacterium]|nr:hypothetical protein [Candidatus Rokubacteria bacterium]
MPKLGEYLALAEVIDLAFDYRGNTTVVKVDGSEVEGYIFNRNRHVPEPFIQMFDLAGERPLKILYSEIQNIKFTGKDMAAGNSWIAWLERKEKEAAEKAPRRDKGME